MQYNFHCSPTLKGRLHTPQETQQIFQLSLQTMLCHQDYSV